MNFRLTMVLVVIMGILGIVLLSLPEKKQVSENPDSSTLLLPAKPANLNSFSFSSDGAEQLKFIRSGDTWTMAAPVKAAVDNGIIQGIVNDLETMGYKEKFEPETTGPRTAEATGTAKPERIVKFTDDANKEYTIGFGKTSVDGIYATFNGGKTIYLLNKDKNLLDRLDQSPDMFRNKEISVSDPAKITGITIKTQDGAVSLEKSDGKWLITSPIHARANATTAEEIVREMSRISAEKFPRLKPQDSMFATPAVTVTAMVEKDAPATSAPATTATTSTSKPAGVPVTLVLSGVYTDISKKNAMYAVLAGSDSVFTVRSTSYDKLNRQLKDLRDPAITPAPVAAAAEFSLTVDGKAALEASKKDDKWTLTGAAPVPLAGDIQAIGDFLGVLRDLRAIQFVDHVGDLPSIGLDPPHMKIELTLPGQSQHEVILVGKVATDANGGKIVPVMRQGEPTVYQVQFLDADRLNVTGLSLRDRTIEHMTGDHIRGVALAGADTLGGGTDLERQGGHWVVKTGDKTIPADDSKISAFLGDFTPLSTPKYLNDKPATGTPAITLTMTVVEPTASAPSTSPAPATATSTAPATAAAITLPGIAKPEMIGPDPGKTTIRTLRLFKQEENKVVTWRGVWDGQDPAWTFEPTHSLIQHVTSESYIVAPASQPATSAAPDTMPVIPAP